MKEGQRVKGRKEIIITMAAAAATATRTVKNSSERNVIKVLCVCACVPDCVTHFYSIMPHASKDLHPYIYLYTNIVRNEKKKRREFFWFAHFWYCFSLVSLTHFNLSSRLFGFELRLAQQHSTSVLFLFSLHALLPVFRRTYYIRRLYTHILATHGNATSMCLK